MIKMRYMCTRFYPWAKRWLRAYLLPKVIQITINLTLTLNSCPDARERAGPVFPPPPHSPTNFKWRPSYTRRCSLMLQKPPQDDTRWPIRIESRLNLYWIRRRYTHLHTAFFHMHSLFIYGCFTFKAVQCSYYYMFDFVIRLLILIKLTTSFLGLRQVHLPHKTSETLLKI